MTTNGAGSTLSSTLNCSFRARLPRRSIMVPFSAGKRTARRGQRRSRRGLDVSDVSNALCVLTALGQLPLGGEPILHVACLGTTTLNPDFVGALTYEVAFLQSAAVISNSPASSQIACTARDKRHYWGSARNVILRASAAVPRGLVRSSLVRAGIPVCVTLAGGYAERIEDTVAINLATLRAFA